MSLDQVNKAAGDVGEMFAMLAERFPEMRPQLEEKARQVEAEIAGVFRPFLDWCDGKISDEEYPAIVAAREEAEQARRVEHYGPDRDVIEAECEHCLMVHEWYVEEQGGYPPVFFECEDVSGEDCRPADDADDDDPRRGGRGRGVVRAFVVSSAAIAACPKRSLLASHYRDDGSCECAHRAEHEARLSELDAKLERAKRLEAKRRAAVEGLEAERQAVFEAMGRPYALRRRDR